MTVAAVEEYDVGPEVYQLDYASEITLRLGLIIKELRDVKLNLKKNFKVKA